MPPLHLDAAPPAVAPHQHSHHAHAHDAADDDGMPLPSPPASPTTAATDGTRSLWTV